MMFIHSQSERRTGLYPNKSRGFTIIELLIVIVVIGILAAITIVSFNGVQRKAIEANVKSDLANAGKKIELLKVTLGTYPAQTDAGLEAADIQLSANLYDTSANNVLYCGSTSSAAYAIVARSKSGTTYAFGSNRAFSEYTEETLENYSQTCSNLVATGAARYGYSTVWREWTGLAP